MKVEIKIPSVGESVSEVVLARWLKNNGDFVKMDEPVLEIESDKASMPVPATAAGQLEIKTQSGETIAVGATVGFLDTDAKAVSAPAKPSLKDVTAPKTAEPESSSEGLLVTERKVRVSPLAAGILDGAGIALEKVKGTGADGRITKEDALQALSQKGALPVAPTPAAPPKAEAAPAPTVPRGERREKMSTLRKTIARRLVQAKNETAMLTTFNEIDMTTVMDLRKKYKDIFEEKHGIKLGFMSFFTRAACVALLEKPIVNATIDETEIVYHDYCDISVAVSTPRGLVTPIVRQAEKMGLHQIEGEIGRLAKKARDGQLTMDEMTGGTFTITNGGVFGSLMSTPIINIPQTAILGLHKIQDRPVALDGQVVIRPMMYVALSYDHRLIDGRESVTFLIRIKELMEDPARLLLQV